MPDWAQDIWDSTLTNINKYVEEIKAMLVGMREKHLPRFKNGSANPFADENYIHLTRNLFTEAFRDMPRTLSGIFIIWLLLKLI